MFSRWVFLSVGSRFQLWGWFLATVFLVKGQINQWNFLLWSGAVCWSVSMPESQRSAGIRCHMLFRMEEVAIVGCCLCASGCHPAVSNLADRLPWDYNLPPPPHLKRIENFSNHQPVPNVSGDDTAAFHPHLLTGGSLLQCSGQRHCNHRRRIDKS